MKKPVKANSEVIFMWSNLISLFVGILIGFVLCAVNSAGKDE